MKYLTRTGNIKKVALTTAQAGEAATGQAAEAAHGGVEYPAKGIMSLEHTQAGVAATRQAAGAAQGVGVIPSPKLSWHRTDSSFKA